MAHDVLELGATMHSAGLDELHREMGTSGDASREVAMGQHQCARSHGFLDTGYPLKKY